MRGPITLAKLAKNVLQTEGLAVFVKKGFIFLTRFQYESHLLYEHALEEEIKINFMPRIQNFTFKIVSSSKQAAELTNRGFELPESLASAKYRLAQGAIAFCFFVDGELAHIGWVAMTKRQRIVLMLIPIMSILGIERLVQGGL